MATKSYLGLKAIIIAKLNALTGGAYLTGSATGTSASKLVDSGATFSSVQVGDVVQNTTDGTKTTVAAIDSATQLSLAADIFVSGEAYAIGAQLFAGVYGVNETEPDGYPAAWVIENTGGGNILDTHRNQREWQFDVIIHIQVGKSRTPETAYDALLDAVDRVITSFDTDPMLLDTNSQAQCQFVRVVPIEFQFGIQDSAFHRAVMTIAVLDVVNRQV